MYKAKKDATSELFTIKEASDWASKYLNKKVTTSNISYLIQYGRIKKIGSNGDTFIVKEDLVKYYDSYLGKREAAWKEQLGDDLNWALSFDNLKEADTTKHVHRLHPYKGKFIPQLVEYFLDGHTDKFKKEVYFKKGDVVLDPFCGSGTTLVQANELGMHAIGLDVSAFNALISNVKVGKYDFLDMDFEIKKISKALKQFIADSNTIKFETKLTQELAKFNNKYFPSPDYKYRVALNEVNEDKYGPEKEKEFLPVFLNLVKEYNIQLKQDKCDSFLDKWYLHHIRTEIDFVCNLTKQIKNPSTKKVLSIILSRTIRSCRATTHADLATLKEPVTTTYYCSKHGKVCKPLFSILSWWERYSKDTLDRLCQFNNLRTDTYHICLTGDSKGIDIFEELEKKNPALSGLVKNQKIKGIFSSPPYVGLIDYHDQHAYAYDLFGFERHDDLEIGHLLKGQGKEARNLYVEGISDVLINCKRFLVDNYDVFLVANDKYNLYPTIAEMAGMQIVNQYKRPVLNRTERDKGAYSEIIFHLKSMSAQ
ncbi:MAG: site-specific DNA-methyltransferase [Methanosarcinales archaeon]|nr:MAG: site-specific DNA-methyltransferase [Methanosarcinales archaeon]